MLQGTQQCNSSPQAQLQMEDGHTAQGKKPTQTVTQAGPTSYYIYILPLSGNYPLFSSSCKQACIPSHFS